MQEWLEKALDVGLLSFGEPIELSLCLFLDLDVRVSFEHDRVE